MSSPERGVSLDGLPEWEREYLLAQDVPPIHTPAQQDHAAPAHDSDAWETVSGWVWVCRTCLDKGFAIGEAHAREMLARHDAGPVPWWVRRLGEPT